MNQENQSGRRNVPRRSSRRGTAAAASVNSRIHPTTRQPQPAAIDINMGNEIIDLTNDDDTSPSTEPQTNNPVSTTTHAISEDDTCPICQLLLHRPVTTRCNHTLCESCMATWADVSVITQMQIVDIDEPALPFNAVSGLEAKCPMCRTQTSATLDNVRMDALRVRYPEAYAEREAEEQANRTTGVDGEVQTLTLSIGNRHSLVVPEDEERSSLIHDWTFFVRPSRTDIIEEVHIHLHPTFRPPRLIRTRPPYEVRRLGWGYFTIVAYIMLKAGYSWMSEDAEDSPDGAEKGMLGLEWTLDFDRFDGRGSMGRVRLKVRNQRGWEHVSDEEEEDGRVWGRLIRQYDRDGRYEPEDEV